MGGRAVDGVGGVVDARSSFTTKISLLTIRLVFSGRAVGSTPLSRLVFGRGAADLFYPSRRVPFCVYFKPCLDVGLHSIAIVASCSTNSRLYVR